ncbi:hypothetical protein [Anatilimnocola floriformis]|uniref:hypothetical protein n=1 Tax=Anatilimnocola floriformis TaxID=2948575 RepID=UPI0020C2D1E5|nr:hypothetical protein [Anatilimnocola floriformis]
MNRSLEALAIFTICLGGILAVVRFSAQDRGAHRVAERTQSAAEPAKNSGSAVEQVAPAKTEMAAAEVTYSDGCGLDRTEGTVYSPCSPLLSPREVALLAIRSEPLPLLILPDVDEADLQTGYDPAYDTAMGDNPLADEELRQIAAEYAAAELAAAAEAELEGVFSELLKPSPVWSLLNRSVTGTKSQLIDASAWLQRSYVDPFSRGIANRWSSSELPQLMTHPRAKAESRRQLMKRQSVQNSQRVGWDDYLDFVDRRLVKKQTSSEGEPQLAREKPRNVLWPR